MGRASNSVLLTVRYGYCVTAVHDVELASRHLDEIRIGWVGAQLQQQHQQYSPCAYSADNLLAKA